MDGWMDGWMSTARIQLGVLLWGMKDPWWLRLGVPKSRSWDKNLSISPFIWAVKPGRIARGMGKRDREGKGREGRQGA